MRGLVTLAAALALPLQMNGVAFPFRDLIIFTAFSVVLGTLVIQGLTLRPLLGVLTIDDDHLVEREVDTARERVMQAAFDALDGDASDAARIVRHEFSAHLRRTLSDQGELDGVDPDHDEIHRRAISAARHVLFELRAKADIGDDAFHQLEEEFDWIEMGTVRREE
jgi:CPA1 family monovalent cation:H+ antiporter